MTPHQILLLSSLALPAWAGINIPVHERQCDGAAWVCRIVCSQGMLGGKGQKANWCVAKHCTRQKAVVESMIAAGQDYCSKNTCFIQETEAIGLLQRPQQGRLALTQVNATTNCLDEKAVCGKFCDGLNSPNDFCMPKCLGNVHAIADALKEYCDECGSPPDYKTTTKKEKTTTEEPTTTEELTTTEETTSAEPTTTTEEPTTTTEESTTTTEEPTTTTEEPTTTDKEYKTTTEEDETTTPVYPPKKDDKDDRDGRRRRRPRGEDDGKKDDDKDGRRGRKDDDKDGRRGRKDDDKDGRRGRK
ncbi:EIF3A, partial [Symbiodinium sp. KB8]